MLKVFMVLVLRKIILNLLIYKNTPIIDKKEQSKISMKIIIKIIYIFAT